ncbi:hypothetical protein J4E91_005493 [Alternaria rosae]|nr:hypothetical protein J4E91_005493 [Alternaria rosae]
MTPTSLLEVSWPSKGNNLKVNMTEYLARFHNSAQWDQTKPATQALFEFSFAGGVNALNEAATKGKKKRSRGKGKKREEAADTPPAFSSGSPLLQGLVAPMPGVRDLDSQVEIIDIGDLSDFNVMSLNKPDECYEDDLDDVVAEDADGMDVYGGVFIIDSADLELWVKRADSGL